jgi:transcriptional regulator of NAD metabolism
MASTSATRREELLSVLERSSGPITGSFLSSTLGVSRQAIVNDIAILRASGHGIIGSSQGYRMDGIPRGLTARIRCHHGPERGREEFEILLDRGVSVLDVGVQHSVFGEVRANVLVESRADIDRHAETIRKAGEAPLSIITRGIHSHTVRAPSEDALDAAKRELSERGILLDD